MLVLLMLLRQICRDFGVLQCNANLVCNTLSLLPDKRHSWYSPSSRKPKINTHTHKHTYANTFVYIYINTHKCIWLNANTHKNGFLSGVFVGLSTLSFTVDSRTSAFKQGIKKPRLPHEFFEDWTCPMQSLLTYKALHHCHLLKWDFYVSTLSSYQRLWPANLKCCYDEVFFRQRSILCKAIFFRAGAA